MKKRKLILAAFLIFALALMLSACASGGDAVKRFAEAKSGSGESISIPGYEKLTFAAGKTAQAVSLKNPPENACVFILTLTLESGEALWTGEALKPGEGFTRITLNRALDAGDYPASLRYTCLSLQDEAPLNGAEIQLTLEVR